MPYKSPLVSCTIRYSENWSLYWMSAFQTVFLKWISMPIFKDIWVVYIDSHGVNPPMMRVGYHQYGNKGLSLRSFKLLILFQLWFTVKASTNVHYAWTIVFLVTVQFSSVAQSCPTLCDPMNCSTPGLPVHHQLLESTQTHVHWVSDAVQPSHPLSSPSPPAFNLSQHQGLFKSVLYIWWLKHWSFSFNINPSNEYSGLISFRIDWLDLLSVQGILKSLLQHHRTDWKRSAF